MTHSPHYWATPADRQTARDWYAAHFTLSESPGQSLNPHRVHWTDYVVQEQLKATAQAELIERRRLHKAAPCRENRVIHTRNVKTLELVTHKNLTEAARYLKTLPNILYEALDSSRSGYSKGHLVWRDDQPEPPPYKQKSLTLWNPATGETIHGTTYIELGKRLGVNGKTVANYFHRRQAHVAGWIRPDDKPLATLRFKRTKHAVYTIDRDGVRRDFESETACGLELFSMKMLINNIKKGHAPRRDIGCSIYYADTNEAIYLDKGGNKMYGLKLTEVTP